MQDLCTCKGCRFDNWSGLDAAMLSSQGGSIYEFLLDECSFRVIRRKLTKLTFQGQAQQVNLLRGLLQTTLSLAIWSRTESRQKFSMYSLSPGSINPLWTTRASFKKRPGNILLIKEQDELFSHRSWPPHQCHSQCSLEISPKQGMLSLEGKVIPIRLSSQRDRNFPN